MPLKPLLKKRDIEQNLSDINPDFTNQQARTESERCLYCFDAPCIQACPTGIDIPSFIKHIAKDNLTGSARTILSSNILGASCARVCPVEELCEGACVMLDREEKPIEIGRLQKHAIDFVFEKNLQVIKAGNTEIKKNIAIIGSGPSGLGCASELAKIGHNVTIFEKDKIPGGLNTHAIAYYKMPPEIALKEVEMIKNLGVNIKLNIEIGKDISGAEILKNYDALFMGIGLGNTYQLGIEGEDKEGVVESLDFIRQIRNQKLDTIPVGENVVVIGCGNTAIDAVTQAKRLGAKNATIVYRRSEKDMPAYEFEYELAKKDSCDFIFYSAPKKVIGENHIEAVEFIKTKIDENGKLIEIPNSEFQVKCDMLLKALGQEKQTNILKNIFPNIELNNNGTIKTNENGETNIKNVFAGGDAVNGGAEVVNAVGMGVKSALNIHKKLTGKSETPPIQSTRHGLLDNQNPFGSGIFNPIRVSELEANYSQ